MKTSQDEPQSEGGRHETSPVEWAVAAVSALLVLGAMGSLLYEALTEAPTPPAVAVVVHGIQQAGSGYLVEFEAVNRGGETAASVAIEGVLREGGEEVETSTATVDYVPPDARRRGGLFFTEDPRAYDLELRATGYDRP